jgi:hypothetical protein
MRWSVSLGVAVAALISLPVSAHAQTALVYDGGNNGFAVEACRRLGLTCDVVAQGEDIVRPLEATPPDVVVMDMPSSEPLDGWESALVSYVERGGALLFTSWNRSSLTRLPDLLGATIDGEHDTLPFYRWQDSPIFDAPERVSMPFESVSDYWGTNGFFLTPIEPAYAVAGFTDVPERGQASIVVGNFDRTIFNGFLFDDGRGDADGDGTTDMIELIMNEISFVLGGGGVSGPCDGLDEGAVCTTPRGSGICRGGNCCTGCWDGTACRGGTTGTACGVGGGACRSCEDGVECSSDLCIAGACANPPAPAATPCDDGLFCTEVDRCTGGTATCRGSGNTCDDGESCTLDSCDEASRACSYEMTSGCFIGGACVGAGVGHVAYPCLVCDPARDATDWSPRAVGETCGAPRCAAGRVTGAGSCDAAGSCVTPPATRCPTGTCADAMMCAAPCTSASCPAGQFCASSGLCMALLSDGAACSEALPCASGFCVDGVCCEAACDGACEACDGAVDGTCAPIASGADPDNECALACDGDGACQDPPDVPRDAGGAADAGHDAGAALDAAVARDAGSAVSPGSRSCACRAAAARSEGMFLALVSLVGLTLGLRRRR